MDADERTVLVELASSLRGQRGQRGDRVGQNVGGSGVKIGGSNCSTVPEGGEAGGREFHRNVAEVFV